MNQNEYDAQNEKFDSWCDKWDAAQDAGIFDDAPKPITPTLQTSDPSFFGLQNTHPTEILADVDTKYWAQVYAMSGPNGNMPPPPIEASPDAMITDNVIAEGKTEIVGNAIEGTTKKSQSHYSPNPITIDSGGPDQDLAAESLGLTFTEKDVVDLAAMKVRLHELEDKLAGAMGTGGSMKGFQTQISTLKKKADQLSTAMTHSFPTDIARLTSGK